MIRISVILISFLVVSGCASITRGTTEAYAIESDPVGATANLSNGLSCKTPCSLKVKRRSDFTVTLEKEGYEIVTATVTSSVDGTGAAGMAGNVLLGGLIGAGIDAGTGAMHSHEPNPLVVKMIKVGEIDSAMDTLSDSTDSGVDPLDMSVGAAKENDVQADTIVDPLDMSVGAVKDNDVQADTMADPSDAKRD